MVRDGLRQSAIDCEGTAPLTVLFTVGNEGSILVETVDDSLEDTVTEVVGLHAADGFAVLVEPETFLSCNLLDPGVVLKRHKHVGLGVGKRVDALVGEHHLTQKLILLYEIHSRRDFFIYRELVALEDIGIDLGADCVKGSLVSHSGLDELLAESHDAVFLLPSLDLFLCTI